MGVVAGVIGYGVRALVALRECVTQERGFSIICFVAGFRNVTGRLRPCRLLNDSVNGAGRGCITWPAPAGHAGSATRAAGWRPSGTGKSACSIPRHGNAAPWPTVGDHPPKRADLGHDAAGRRRCVERGDRRVGPLKSREFVDFVRVDRIPLGSKEGAVPTRMISIV